MIFCRILTYFVTGMDFKNPRSGQMNDFCMEILWPQMKKPKLRPQCPRLMSVLLGFFFSPPFPPQVCDPCSMSVYSFPTASVVISLHVLFLCIQCSLSLLLFFIVSSLWRFPSPRALVWTDSLLFCGHAALSFFFRSHPRLIFCHRLQQVIKINGSHSACGLWRMRHKQSARSSFRG